MNSSSLSHLQLPAARSSCRLKARRSSQQQQQRVVTLWSHVPPRWGRPGVMAKDPLPAMTPVALYLLCPQQGLPPGPTLASVSLRQSSTQLSRLPSCVIPAPYDPYILTVAPAGYARCV